MARRRGGPLPELGLGPSVASDWLTGDVSESVVWRRGKWWTAYHYKHVQFDRERDRHRIRRNNARTRFLQSQPIAGL